MLIVSSAHDLQGGLKEERRASFDCGRPDLVGTTAAQDEECFFNILNKERIHPERSPERPPGTIRRETKGGVEGCSRRPSIKRRTKSRITISQHPEEMSNRFRSLIAITCLLAALHPLQAQWAPTNGPNVGQVYRIAASPAGGGAGSNLLVGMSENGIYLSTNNGSNWSPANAGLTNVNIRSLFVSGTRVFAGTLNGVFVSTDNGASWSSSGLSNIFVFAFAVSGSNLFAGTSNGMFLSTNNGATWTEINTGLTNPAVTSLAVSPSGATIFAGTFGGVFVSTNNGASWTQTALKNAPTALSISGSSLFAGTLSGVYRTTNNGAIWTDVNYGMTNTSVYDLLVVGTKIFAGTFGGGIFLSANNGASWMSVNAGLTNINVYAFGVSGTTLFAATEGGGVWKRALSELVTSVEDRVSDLPTHIRLDQNYPNPFNPQTAISYQLIANSYLTLRVFDALGRHVATLVDGETESGKHTVLWNASGVPSGVYYYRLQAGNCSETRKLVLLR
jgi:hypothetical protein